MNTSSLKLLVAALLVAASLGTSPARADGLDVGVAVDRSQLGDHAGQPDDHLAASDPADIDMPTDEWRFPGPIGSGHVNLDVAGRDIGRNAMQLELGPQYRMSGKLTVGGEWELVQPFFTDEHENIDRYSFGLRVAF
jgi:hypothetical protein